MVRFVNWYFERYLRKHWQSVRMVSSSTVPTLTGPTVIYLNHPSWWDPITCAYFVRRYFAHREHFAPIDAAALRKYKFLSKIGLFGIDRHSRRSTADFLRTCEAIFTRDTGTLWVTAEGDFTDPRVRPVVLRPGIAHLARRHPQVTFIPMAIEYTHWQERKGEVLVNFGRPRQFSGEMSVDAIHESLTGEMTGTLDTLAAAAMTRDPSRFVTLMASAGGVHPVYDAFRRVIAKLRGQSFSAVHAERGEP